MIGTYMCTFFPHAKRHSFAMTKHAFAELTSEVRALLLQEENMRKAGRSVCLSLFHLSHTLCVCVHTCVCFTKKGEVESERELALWFCSPVKESVKHFRTAYLRCSFVHAGPVIKWLFFWGMYTACLAIPLCCYPPLFFWLNEQICQRF